MDAVAALDAAYARLDADHPRNALSSGLDAIRFPGAEATERARTERAAATHSRLAELSDGTRLLRTRLRARTADGGTPVDRATLLRSRAAVQNEGARLLDELAALEPELADEYRTRVEEARTRVEEARSLAAGDHEFPDLFAPPNTVYRVLERHRNTSAPSTSGGQ
ncbi:hypothetical protein [Streptomyces scabiei]|uniref:hypothetical protein n=1 Tax=Streptomyces scabiei TaxID=1930 RepID=UPI0029B1D79B|nr:hypothetical protein [Streptomyces scabiei]MDX3524718.1 hypothetical protein [Streptomyces scabiei]